MTEEQIAQMLTYLKNINSLLAKIEEGMGEMTSMFGECFIQDSDDPNIDAPRGHLRVGDIQIHVTRGRA